MAHRLDRDGEVFVLHLDDGENRFNRGSVDALHAFVGEVEETDGPRALVTVGTGKFFSNGLDLEALAAAGPDANAVVGDVLRLFGRILGAPFPTVAAINGHAFAGGAMLALTHDRRVMRADRGFFCVNEVHLGMNLTRGMAGIIMAKLSRPTANRVITGGERHGGEAALSAGIVDATAGEDQLLATAVELAGGLAPTASPTLAALKRRLYGELLDVLADDGPDRS